MCRKDVSPRGLQLYDLRMMTMEEEEVGVVSERQMSSCHQDRLSRRDHRRRWLLDWVMLAEEEVGEAVVAVPFRACPPCQLHYQEAHHQGWNVPQV